MSIRARARRKPTVLAEVAALPPHDRAVVHRKYSSYVQAVLRRVAQELHIQIRGPIGPLP